MKRPAAMWCQRAWRAEVKKGSAFALLFVQRTTGTFFFIHSHVRTYVYALPTNKHKRFKIDGLKPFFMWFSKLYLHMATHGYTCVNPVLVLFYTCSFVFFQFYTCVTPFFWGFTHGYTWLHMATHPLHIFQNFQGRQLYGLRFCHSLGGRGLNVRHLIQINPSNWPFKLKTSQNVLLSTGFLYDYILKMGMDMNQNDVHFLAPGMPFVWFSKFIVSDTVMSRSRT